jgi:hypothetical protein
VRASTIALCLGMIIALELLQRKSDRSEGFMKTASSTNVQLWATVLPALALTGLALLYSSIYTNTSVLAPYHALTKKTGEAAKRSIATEYLGSTPIFCHPDVHTARPYVDSSGCICRYCWSISYCCCVWPTLRSIERCSNETQCTTQR